ncbi:hypothetical protein M9H77_07053 [Catharanthus roseus]|uniref:Uncharacterized protein n=1 Tax=Catharanthus roseus TaxID=4058 RepID=A0ACC0BTU2_CATRO|nr:hypothetical protein M9H77_07053 [Catharanthus roseus]
MKLHYGDAQFTSWLLVMVSKKMGETSAFVNKAQICYQAQRDKHRHGCKTNRWMRGGRRGTPQSLLINHLIYPAKIQCEKKTGKRAVGFLVNCRNHWKTEMGNNPQRNPILSASLFFFLSLVHLRAIVVEVHSKSSEICHSSEEKGLNRHGCKNPEIFALPRYWFRSRSDFLIEDIITASKCTRMVLGSDSQRAKKGIPELRNSVSLLSSSKLQTSPKASYANENSRKRNSI